MAGWARCSVGARAALPSRGVPTRKGKAGKGCPCATRFESLRFSMRHPAHANAKPMQGACNPRIRTKLLRAPARRFIRHASTGATDLSLFFPEQSSPLRHLSSVMQLITTTADLATFCERQRGAAFITVDTEFMRERTYW